MSTPFFTIVTPTLNSEKYLRKCIESVESQSFKDWEHIFIDSFSTDRTISLLKEYKKRNPKKVFIHQYLKAGVSDAFNKGIKNSKGKYINFLGSDDLLEKNSLQIVYNNISDEKYGWCYGDVKIIDGKGLIKKLKKYMNFNYNSLLYFFYICHQSVFMKRSIFENYGLFRVDLKYAMDHEYFLRIGKQEKPLKMNSFICSFRKDGTNTSSNWKEVLSEKRMINLKYSNNRLLTLLFHKITFLIKFILI